MISDSNKRQASLSILQRLRRQGLPDREERMESMFDSLTGDMSEGDEDGEDSGEEPSYEMQSPETQEKERQKKRLPKKGFMSVK